MTMFNIITITVFSAYGIGVSWYLFKQADNGAERIMSFTPGMMCIIVILAIIFGGFFQP